MKDLRFHLLLALVLAAACFGIWRWQAPGEALTPAEVERYVAGFDADLPLPPQDKAELLAGVRRFAEADDGRPVYMLNLMRYFEALRPAPGIPETYAGTPREANALYEAAVIPMALEGGAQPLFAGEVAGRNVAGADPAEDGWSRVILMRYPSRRAFLDLLSRPDYRAVMPYKMQALHLALVPVRAEIVLPGLVPASVTLAVLLFLAIGWWRAARRARTV
ncbi:hypothetical protein [Zavarzinia aquatilis]|uniref:DUF1330 domain-containing protein n=1 Tax=Zavarzinia aquatilis TaxID=2211142 RepID=A0A317EJN5_9PROT|nr:hypothetical protein [Zavarzinia aquatilis]PWR25455.1 hypothetical protein DKG74_00275 [Zavarzinia aquatilis]